MIVEDLPELGITRVSRWIFNCYVIHDGGAGRPVIVDAGLPSIAEAALEVVEERGLGSVAAVLATHGHSDHVAGAATVASATGASVHLPERTMEFLDGAEAQMVDASCHGRVGLSGLLHGCKSGSLQSREVALAVGPRVEDIREIPR